MVLCRHSLVLVVRKIASSPAVAHVPEPIGFPPPLPRDPLIPEPLQKGDGHAEVALIFVNVLQGFETFVHRTEIWQRR